MRITFKKVVTAVSLVTTLVALDTASCDSTSQGDKTPVVSCDPPKGYAKAGRAAKAAKGQFYGCMKNNKPCIIFYTPKGSTQDRKKSISLYKEGFFTVPKNAKNWRTDNCGAIYKNDRKGAHE